METAAKTAEHILLSQPIDIPVFHEVALRLQQMLHNNSYRIEEVIKLINEDTALATEMLRHANSSYYSGKDQITTIKNAIVRLGSQQVVNLAFTASMANSKSDNPIINKLLKNLWHHSHTVAMSSALLAIQVIHDKGLNDLDADEVYLGGLLHDIGKLYLLKSADKLISAGQLHADEGLINKLVEASNIDQGLKVMRHFKIPDIYSNAVERHIATEWKSGVNDYLVATIRLSCKMHICLGQEVNPGNAYMRDQVSEELELLGINDIDYVCSMINAITY